MKLPRGLSADEEAAWARLASSVEPIAGRKRPPMELTVKSTSAAPEPPKPRIKKGAAVRSMPKPPTARIQSQVQPQPRIARRIGHTSLDSHWDRKLKSGAIAPDYTLDLHDHFVDAAHARLDSGMLQARAMDARLVLIITGRPRPVEAADRASRRGVIRAKILDWLAAGEHADAIAAIRKAHRRHGGEGALYVVLRRNR